VELTTLSRLEQLIQNQRLTRPNDTSDGANAAIRAAMVDSAVRAASRVMSQIEPAKYFSDYERWEVSDNDGVDETGQNYVRNQLVRAVAAELKADFLAGQCRVSPRRVDSRVASIIRLIQQIGDIEVTVKVEPADSEGPHDASDVTFNYYIGDVYPDEIANVIQRGDDPLPRARLERDLKDWSFEALSGRPRQELQSLSVRHRASYGVQKRLEDDIVGKVKVHYGVVVGIKSISAGYSEVDGVERTFTGLRLREQKARIQAMDRAIAESAGPSDDEIHRGFLRSRAEVLQQLIRDNPSEQDEDFRLLEQHKAELNEIRAQLSAANKTILQTPRHQLERARGATPPPDEPQAPIRDVTPPRDASL
jgi:hypothetical protein